MVTVYLISKNKSCNQNYITQLQECFPEGRKGGARGEKKKKKIYLLPHLQTKNNCFVQYKTLFGAHGKIRQITFTQCYLRGIFLLF